MAVFNNTGILRKVIVARPTYFALLSVSDTARDAMDANVAIDHKAAMKQHEEYCHVFRQVGVDVVYVEPILEKYPWQNGARDWGLATPSGALIGKFRYYERRGEEEQVIATFKREAYPIIGRVTRGALEGGDCFYLDEKTVAIAHGNRSTLAGVEDAASHLGTLGIEVLPVELYDRWNHLDMVFSVIGEKLALGCKDALPDFFLGFLKGRGFEVRLYPGEMVAGKCTLNLVNLGNGRVLSWRGNPVNVDLKAMGLEVYDVEFGQFVLAGGGPHCLCHELDRDR
jgi:N-dimethylarginine dimethylaminohydrolase